MGFHWIPMGFLWGFFGILLGFDGMTIGFLWYFNESTSRIQKMSMGFKRLSMGVSMVFPWDSLRISIGFSRGFCGISMAFLCILVWYLSWIPIGCS